MRGIALALALSLLVAVPVLAHNCVENTAITSAPGSVTARIVRITISTNSDGIMMLDARSIPFTPRNTTNPASAIATAWNHSTFPVHAKSAHSDPGSAPLSSPLTAPQKYRSVQPITTV